MLGFSQVHCELMTSIDTGNQGDQRFCLTGGPFWASDKAWVSDITAVLQDMSSSYSSGRGSKFFKERNEMQNKRPYAQDPASVWGWKWHCSADNEIPVQKRFFGNIHTDTLYVYTLGAGGSPGTPAPWVFIYIMKLVHGRCYASNGLGWGGVGMITFLALAHMVGATQHHVSCTCTHGWCYATSCFLHWHTWLVLLNIMFLALAHMVGATQHHVSCTCTDGRCCATSWGEVGLITFLALAHMVGATQHHVSCTCTHGWCYATSCFLHLHTWLVLRNIMFLALAHMVGATQHHVSCTCTHGRCYATSWGGVGLITFLALAHMVGATQHHVSCTCTHGWCYATSCFLHLHTWSVHATSCFLHLHTWLVLRNIMFFALAHMVGARNIMFLALAHMVGATQHHVSCTCTHGRCYATSWGGVGMITFLALAHMVGATQHHVCRC